MRGAGAPEPAVAPAPARLRRLIRASRVLDAAQKQAWLDVLPLMTPVHRAELLAILQLERADEPAAEG